MSNVSVFLANRCQGSGQTPIRGPFKESRLSMKNLSLHVALTKVQVLAEAEFTKDMAENLLSMCSAIPDGHSVTLQICNKGVWGKTSAGIRLFIGSTTIMHGEPKDDDAGRAY